MDTIKIGNFLAELRKEQGLTQEALGEKLGITNKTVSRWEKAEETIADILSAGSFSVKERTDFWKRKWQKDHLLTNICISAILFIALAAGIALSSPLVIGLIPVLALFTFMKRRNDMMIYVENNLYGLEK